MLSVENRTRGSQRGMCNLTGTCNMIQRSCIYFLGISQPTKRRFPPAATPGMTISVSTPTPKCIRHAVSSQRGSEEQEMWTLAPSQCTNTRIRDMPNTKYRERPSHRNTPANQPSLPETPWVTVGAAGDAQGPNADLSPATIWVPGSLL